MVNNLFSFPPLGGGLESNSGSIEEISGKRNA